MISPLQIKKVIIAITMMMIPLFVINLILNNLHQASNAVLVEVEIMTFTIDKLHLR
jgi:hypothetical protein